MEKPVPIHPTVIARHAKIKAWNEYVIDYFGLNLVKREVKGDYRYMAIVMGNYIIFELYDFQLRRTTNAEMHRKLMAFLEKYLAALKQFNDYSISGRFMPPPL